MKVEFRALPRSGAAAPLWVWCVCWVIPFTTLIPRGLGAVPKRTGGAREGFSVAQLLQLELLLPSSARAAVPSVCGQGLQHCSGVHPHSRIRGSCWTGTGAHCCCRDELEVVSELKKHPPL